MKNVTFIRVTPDTVSGTVERGILIVSTNKIWTARPCTGDGAENGVVTTTGF
jgi:hypothetical protein